MRAELERQLELDFPFMRRQGGRSSYGLWGCECGDGWYGLIRDLCRAIGERYAQAGKPADLVILQVKEKFATLRFYYEYPDAPCPILAIDSLGDGSGVRLAPGGGQDAQLRKEIARLVAEYEEKSAAVCESCGAPGTFRKDLAWKKTLCETCYADCLRRSAEQKRQKKDISEYL